jgi:hypothetical protein
MRVLASDAQHSRRLQSCEAFKQLMNVSSLRPNETESALHFYCHRVHACQYGMRLLSIIMCEHVYFVFSSEAKK